MASNERNYPFNCWWVAGRAGEVGRQPIRRWLLDTPVVMYRTTDGTVVALYDRCPHRWAPLSEGYLDGDDIVCPYHGISFRSDGKCDRIPTQEKVPDKMCVKAFSLVERGPFLWIWMGDDAARARAELPPDFAWANETGWTVTTGEYEFMGNYMLLHENVLDLTHFNYVHAKSFRISNWAPPTYETDGTKVWFHDTLYPEAFNAEERALIGIDHPATLHNVTEGAFVTPAFHFAKSTTRLKPGSSVPEEIRTHIAHMVTPANYGHTYYWWLVGTDRPMPEEARNQFGSLISRAFHEDKAILEAVQQNIANDRCGSNYPEISVKGDTGGVLARRVVTRLVDIEKMSQSAV